MRVFSATLATETNTFAPMPTGLSSFKERGYYKAGQHPDHMSFFAGPLWAARLRGKAQGWTLLEGVVAAAQPSGSTTAYANPEGIFVRSGPASIRALPAPPDLAVDKLSWLPDESALIASGLLTRTNRYGIWRISASGEPPRLLREQARRLSLRARAARDARARSPCAPSARR
jgi:hypothetical protein